MPTRSASCDHPSESERRWRFSDPAFHAYAREIGEEEFTLVSRLAPAARAAAESEIRRNASGGTAELAVILEHASALLQHGPPEPHWAELTEWLLYSAHDHLSSLGHFDPALRCLAAVEEWWNRLPPPQKAMPRWRRERCTLLSQRADLLTQLDNFPGALRAAREACELLQAIVRESSSESHIRQLRALSEKVADLCTVTGDEAGAVKAYSDVEELLSSVSAEAAPSDGENQRQAVLTQLAVGDLEYRKGHNRSAVNSYADALRLAKSLAPTAPNEIYLALSKMGRAQMSCDDFASARDTFSEACTVAEHEKKKDGAEPHWQVRLSAMLSRLGDSHLALENLDAAIDAYRRDLALVSEAATAKPDDIAAQREVSVSLLKVGQALSKAGDFDAARTHIEEACRVRQRLLAAEPLAAVRKRELMIALSQAGSVHMMAGNPVEATGCFQSALSHANELCDLEPENQERQRDRALLREQIAVLIQ